MTEWTKYTGQQTQLDEMISSETGFIVDSEFSVFKDRAVLKYPLTDDNRNWLANHLISAKVSKYLICNPHPRREMAKQQFDTGQPVWVKVKLEKPHTIPAGLLSVDDNLYDIGIDFCVLKTIKPNWHIP